MRRSALSTLLLLAALAVCGLVAQQPGGAPVAAGGSGRGGRGGSGRGAGGGGANADPWAGKKKLLAVADVGTGFHHDSISHALATVEKLGRESGAYVTMIRTDPQLITKQQITGIPGSRYNGRGVNARTLDYYDAVFLLPSGPGTLTPQQKADLLSFVRDDGKGVVVGHAATVGYYDWPEFGELIGGWMSSEFNANSSVIVEDPAFPGADAFGPGPFLFNEQHPVLKEPYSRDKIHVIMRLDPAKLGPADRARRADGDFPVVWAQQYGKGRMYNVGWGHDEATWDDPRFQKMVLGGIKWALGITKADATPRPLPATAGSPGN
jgi:type 1 glutamine amidotransferase